MRADPSDVRMCNLSLVMAESYRNDPTIESLVEQGLSFDLVTYNNKPFLLTLNHIYVDPDLRGNRLGSLALELLTKMADDYGVILNLEIGRDEAGIGLLKWYERHGFEYDDQSKFMIRRNVTKIGYHVTTQEAINSIQKEGLCPRIGPRSTLVNEPYPRVYFFINQQDAEDAISNWLGELIDEDEKIFVLKVDLNGIQTYQQPGQFEMTVDCHVDANRIVAVYDENMKLVRKRFKQPT